jgi:zinc protease
MTAITRRAALQAAAAAAAAGTLAAEARAQAAATAAEAERPLFGATLRTLPNGLRVAFVEQRRAPVIAQYAYVAAGGGEDPAGRSGVAHFLEHMMFKGSPRVASGEFSRRVAREGGNDNAYTSRDVTAYFQHVEASRLDLVAMMEADRFAAARIPAAELESERLVILEERAQRTGSSPRALFFENFQAAMWGEQHWHGRPIIGWEDEIRAITHDDLMGFFRARYAAGNAVLVVAGAVAPDAFWSSVEQNWAALPAGPAVPRDRAAPPAAIPTPRFTRNDPRLRGEAVFLRSWQAPTLTAGEARHGEPLEVLRHILGGGPGSRLHRALVEGGLAVSAGASYDSDAASWTDFDLSATPRRDVEPPRVEEAAMAVVKRLLDEGGPTEAEVARSIRQMTAGALLALDGLGAAPRMIGNAPGHRPADRDGGVLAAAAARRHARAGGGGRRRGARPRALGQRVAAARRGGGAAGGAAVSGTFTLDIQQVTAGDRSAWLIEDQSVPVVSIAWAWRGGAALDPAEHAGALSMAAALLTEGAGPLEATAFADALRDEAIGLGFDAGRDGMEGSLRALRPSLPEAVRLANLAMRSPRLDASAVARVRARAVAGARAGLETPRGQVGRAFWAAAYPQHPAGRPTGGTVETLTALPEEAITAALARQLRADGLLVAAAGAITADELAKVIPALFEGLPAGAPPEAPALPAFTAFGRRLVDVASPQSAILFGQPGLPVADPDWETAQVVLRVLGGGGFSSRLMEAVRVQRG